MNTAIERLIQQIYTTVYKQVFNGPRLTALKSGNKQPIRNALDVLDVSQKYQQFAQKFATELAKKGVRGQKGLWRKHYKAAQAAHYIALPPTVSAYEASIMTKAIAHNMEMIKSIPQRMKEVLGHKYTSTLIEQVAKGSLGRGSFEKQLASHGVKQAKLIARTETAKLQTAILENRAVDIGGVVYKWRASHDKRTRPSHREMDNVIVFWKQQKPLRDNMRGHAGEFPNCRCTPQPIFDESDLPDSTYKVYDYRTDKIVNISKKELLQAIQNGNLN